MRSAVIRMHLWRRAISLRRGPALRALTVPKHVADRERVLKEIPHTPHLVSLERLIGELTGRPLLYGNRIVPLHSGEEAYPAMLEAIEECEKISGRKLEWTYVEDNRIGDHIWWISDVRKFQRDFPEWKYRYGIGDILREIHDACSG